MSAPSDRLEREADRMADHVVGTSHAAPISELEGLAVQRTCAACEDREVQRVSSTTARAISAFDGSSESTAATAGLEAGVSSLAGRGQRLPSGERAFFESRFGFDFSNVRIHADTEADGMARSVDARAFTLGNDIVFGGGELQLGTVAGRRLIAHELTHVAQQRAGRDRGTVQRAVSLASPGRLAPAPPQSVAPPQTRATTLQDWLQDICSEGHWAVDPTTGAVDSANRATFCAAQPTPGQAHRSTSGTPVGCQCLCDATEPGSKMIRVQIGNYLRATHDGKRYNSLLESTGGAGTSIDRNVVASRGFGFLSPTGVGDTAPVAPGTGSRAQSLRVPAWLAFAHELCGHALPQADQGHTATPEGNRSAVDVENQLRREHSTTADSLGIRLGEFHACNATGAMAFTACEAANKVMRFKGAAYRMAAGETLPDIAIKIGIPVTNMLDHIWRSNGERITAATQNTLAIGEELLIEGLGWHEVISGENLSSIATLWGVALAAIKRANPQVTAPSYIIHPGDRILIPVR